MRCNPKNDHAGGTYGTGRDPGAAAGRKRAMLTYDREANYKMLKWIYDSIIKDNS